MKKGGNTKGDSGCGEKDRRRHGTHEKGGRKARQGKYSRHEDGQEDQKEPLKTRRLPAKEYTCHAHSLATPVPEQSGGKGKVRFRSDLVRE